MRSEFILDERLGILVPELSRDWDAYSREEQAELLAFWEQIRGRIPERVIQLEQEIIRKQNRLDVEDDFAVSCALNSEIAVLASVINDLHIWYRVNQDVSAGPAHH